MSENYSLKRYRDRNARIVAAKRAGSTVDALTHAFELSKAQIYRIIKNAEVA